MSQRLVFETVPVFVPADSDEGAVEMFKRAYCAGFFCAEDVSREFSGKQVWSVSIRVKKESGE